MHRELTWIFEYILKCHPDPKTFVAQVGNGDIDHSYLGRAETMTTERPVYKLPIKTGPDSPLAPQALALCSIIFKDIDNSLSTRCLKGRNRYTP
jgi:hypothetical protein